MGRTLAKRIEITAQRSASAGGAVLTAITTSSAATTLAGAATSVTAPATPLRVRAAPGPCSGSGARSAALPALFGDGEESLGFTGILDYPCDRLQRLRGQPERAQCDPAHPRIPHRSEQVELTVDARSHVFIKEVGRADAEELRQRLQMTLGRVVPLTRPQLPEVGGRDGGAAARSQCARDTFATELLSARPPTPPASSA